MLKKKMFSFAAIFTLLLSLFAFSSPNASADEFVSTFNLEDIKLTELKPGDVIEYGDYTISHYTYEEAAKIIAEQKGISYEEARNEFSINATCANGATAFSRTLNVTSSYKPTFHTWTELCANSAGQYVVKSIVDLTMNRNYNGTVKHFDGGLNAKALNSGKTLYVRAEGDFYNTGDTTYGVEVGFGTAVASINLYASKTTSHYGYIHFTENIILFK